MAIIGNPIIAAVKTEVDTRLDDQSTNPVENRVIAAWTKEPELTLYQDEDTKLVYIATLDGVLLGDGILVEGGGGGGGGGNTYKIRLTNLMDSRDVLIAQGGSAVLAFRYISTDEEGVDDGTGVGTLKVNGRERAKFTVQQGDNVYDVSKYIENGTNTVVITAENSEGYSKTLKYTITVVALGLSSTFSTMASYRGDVIYQYLVTGAGTKTMHFKMDGLEIGTDEISTSGRNQSYTISEQSHGGHILEVYATVMTEGMLLRSETLRYGMLWIDDTSSIPVITSTFDITEATEGENLCFPFIVYDPVAEQTEVTLTVFDKDRNIYSTATKTVGRTPTEWNLSDYPSGNIRVRLSCGSARVEFPINVIPFELPVSKVTDGLVLEFDPKGRTNSVANPGHWEYGEHDEIVATFTGFGWTGADGWVDDADGTTVLRFLPGDTMTIPFQLFATDARNTGCTVEVEVATRDVRDYESLVISCMNAGRGFQIATQEASLHSELSGISMIFKEDSRIRVAFSVENKNLNRFIYIYINGIMCGVVQYPTDDNFQQPNPVGITIGSNTCGLDLYKIRLYNRGLTKAEQLDNFIIDRPTLEERVECAERNDILNESEEVAIDKLPADLPYMVIHGSRIPASKDEDDATVEISFVDPLHTDRSWHATGVKLGIQGTSSAGYPIKNWKFKLKKGIVYNTPDSEGEERTDSGFPITPGQLPTKTICWKADFASSENANNIVLAKFYNDICPYKDPAQQDDPLIRQGVDGFSSCLFWEDTSTDPSTWHFFGKGNCNIDKGNDYIFGFTEDYPNAESWEFLNNTSARCLFSGDDFNVWGVNEKGQPCRAWQNDFEARYPDDEDEMTDAMNQTKIQNWASVVSWVASTDRNAVQSQADKDARLLKFKNEFSQHFVPQAMFFYYVFTETFLLMDNRAKNMFMTTFDGTHWFTLPYDFDSCLGINNEGALVFEYNLEDTDIVNGEDVFTGQQSVLWNNVRDAFPNELRSMYMSLRSLDDHDPSHESPFSYYRVAKLFTDHQAVWPEALWNEDAYTKYMKPYLVDGEDYLSRMQGSKASQRDWWLFNAFCYRDSKYQCGDAMSKRIVLRTNAIADITITPYSHIYGHVRFGSYDTIHRCTRNVPCLMECNADNLSDTETYIYSADRLSSVGDLSPLMVGEWNSAAATKLREVKLGDESANYENQVLGTRYSVNLGNNELLETVNVANCTGFGTGEQKTLDLSGCSGIKTVIATGTSLHGVLLPDGGHLTTLKLPATITNLTIMNQKDLTTLVLEGVTNISTLRIENTTNVPLENIILNSTALDRVRLIDIDYTVSSAAALQNMYNKLVQCTGINADGSNTQQGQPVVSGILRVNENVSATLLNNFTDHMPNVLVVANGQATCRVRFRNWDGQVLDTQECNIGGSVADPVVAGRIQTPVRPDGDKRFYTYAGWDKPLTNIQSNLIVTAMFDEERAYEVTFVNDDVNETELYIALVHEGDTAPDPVATLLIDTPTKATDAQYSYTYVGWQSPLVNITEDKVIKARYATEASITVIFANYDNTELYRDYVERGGNVSDPVVSGAIQTPTRAADSANQTAYVYSGWDTSLNGILSNITIKARYTTVQYFVVIFKNPDEAGGNILCQLNLNAGLAVNDPVRNGIIQTPTRDPEATYNYIYKGWNAILSSNVQQNLTYTAVYKTDRQFSVSFVDWDGTVLDSQLVYDEDDAVEPIAAGRIATPVKSPTAQYSYAFNAWSGTYTFVTENRTITATYTSTTRRYSYRFINNDNTVLASGTVDYGTTVTPPANPTYTPENIDMVFTGWEPGVFTIVANTDFIAQYVDTSSITAQYVMGTLTEYSNDSTSKIRPYGFGMYTNITSIRTGASYIGGNAFWRAYSLETLDLSNNDTVTFGNSIFSETYGIKHVIVRSSNVNTGLLNYLGSKFYKNMGYGVIYVPQELVSAYEAANANLNFKPISSYPMNDTSTITDSWAEIVSNPNYATDYHIGDRKLVQVEKNINNGVAPELVDIYMELVAMDTDILSDNSGKARMTWVANAVAQVTSFNNTSSSSPPLVDWSNCKLRTDKLPTYILAYLPEALQQNIKEVNKTYLCHDGSTQTSADKIWIPSLRELFGDSSNYTVEDSGVTYANISRNMISVSQWSYGDYWTRSASTTNTSVYKMSFQYSNTNPTATSIVNNAYIRFGFCI